MIHTVGSRWPETGIVNQGGFASHVRVHEYWAYPIPEELESRLAAPMMCGGITAYSPMVSYTDIAGKKVGANHIGGRQQVLAMLELAARKQIRPWIEEAPLSAESLRGVVDNVGNNQARFSGLFTGYSEAFP